MKAIIMERRGEYAAVLCEDGTFIKTRVGGEVGESVELQPEVLPFPAKRRNRWMRGAAAAILALAITGGTLGYMGNTASAYVSFDVDEDSAIELTINHFGRVIAVNALDDASKELAECLFGELRHRRADDAFDITMDRLRDRGYFAETGCEVIVGVAADNERRASELKGFAERSVESGGSYAAYVAETSRAERERAMEDHVSIGRFGYERDHGGAPAPNGKSEPPQGGGQPMPGQEQPPRDGGQPMPGQEQPPQGGEQPMPGQEQPPRDGEQPMPGQEQPPRDGEQPMPGQEQPPRDGEQPMPGQEQPPRDGEQPMPGQEQPPQGGGQPMPGQE